MFIYLEDGDVAEISADGYQITSVGALVKGCPLGWRRGHRGAWRARAFHAQGDF